MGAGASARFDELPEELELQVAQDWAEKFGMLKQDWPEEKWAEFTGSADGGSISRDAFLKLCKELMGSPGDLNPSPNQSSSENLAADNGGYDDEEVFAADGELDQSMDDELAKGTFDEDEPDADDLLGGMEVPGLSLDGQHLDTSAGGGGDATLGNGAIVAPVGTSAASGGQFSGEKEEVLMVDGEAFGTATGPGCFDEEAGADGGGDFGGPGSPHSGGELLVVGVQTSPEKGKS